jgi:hypothetical protein
MAYQLLTGEFPFTVDSHAVLVYEKLHGEAMPLEKLRQDIPQALRFAVHRAMHKDKELRYDSWKAFCDDLAVALPHLAGTENVQLDSSHFDALRKLTFFDEFTDREIWETVHISNWRNYAQGEVIVQECDTGSSLFIITLGDVVVTKGGMELGIMNTGESFGEMSYLDKSQKMRSASVTAATNLCVIEIEGDSLHQATDALQASFARTFITVMVARLRDTDQRLISALGLL